MSFFYEDLGRTWHLWTDAQGQVHDEPVTPVPAPQPIEPETTDA